MLGGIHRCEFHCLTLALCGIEKLTGCFQCFSHMVLLSFNLASFLDIQSLYGKHPVTRNQLYMYICIYRLGGLGRLK